MSELKSRKAWMTFEESALCPFRVIEVRVSGPLGSYAFGSVANCGHVPLECERGDPCLYEIMWLGRSMAGILGAPTRAAVRERATEARVGEALTNGTVRPMRTDRREGDANRALSIVEAALADLFVNGLRTFTVFSGARGCLNEGGVEGEVAECLQAVVTGEEEEDTQKMAMVVPPTLRGLIMLGATCPREMQELAEAFPTEPGMELLEEEWELEMPDMYEEKMKMAAESIGYRMARKSGVPSGPGGFLSTAVDPQLGRAVFQVDELERGLDRIEEGKVEDVDDEKEVETAREAHAGGRLACGRTKPLGQEEYCWDALAGAGGGRGRKVSVTLDTEGFEEILAEGMAYARPCGERANVYGFVMCITAGAWRGRNVYLQLVDGKPYATFVFEE